MLQSQSKASIIVSLGDIYYQVFYKLIKFSLLIQLSKSLSFLFLGAQKEGAAGFFKGVGKGLVGAVARPTGGIIDMASSTFQGIKR